MHFIPSNVTSSGNTHGFTRRRRHGCGWIGLYRGRAIRGTWRQVSAGRCPLLFWVFSWSRGRHRCCSLRRYHGWDFLRASWCSGRRLLHGLLLGFWRWWHGCYHPGGRQDEKGMAGEMQHVETFSETARFWNGTHEPIGKRKTERRSRKSHTISQDILPAAGAVSVGGVTSTGASTAFADITKRMGEGGSVLRQDARRSRCTPLRCVEDCDRTCLVYGPRRTNILQAKWRDETACLRGRRCVLFDGDHSILRVLSVARNTLSAQEAGD